MPSSMQPPSPPQEHVEPGVLTQPKMFRRATGAHAILSSLLIADLIGACLALLLGALGTPLLWWLARAVLGLLHSSLPLTIGVVLSLGALLIDAVMQGTGSKKNADAAWGTALIVIVVVAVILLLFLLLHVPWLTIPVPMIPAPRLEPYTLLMVPTSTIGVVVAAALVTAAHVLVLQQYHDQAEQQHATYSRAHPDGDAWWTIDSAYGHFRRGLARFDPPPIPTLKTPASFLYYVADAAITDPERKLYWDAGELVLPRELISVEKDRAEVLLPYLARVLFDYQISEVRLVDSLFQCLRIARKRRFFRLMLRFPLRVARSSETRWLALEKERVLDRDRFAFWCGQGARLRKQLVHQLQLRDKRHEEDNAIPSLAERIDHLRSLLREESRQVQKLRSTVALGAPSSAHAANAAQLPPETSS